MKKNDIFITTDKKLNKIERSFLEELRKKKNIFNLKYIILEENELKKFSKKDGTIDEFLDSFIKRRIHLSLNNSEEDIYFLSFSLFDFYIKNKSEYRLYISNSLKVLKESGILSNLDLPLVLLFQEKKSLDFYLTLIKNKERDKIIIKIDELKEILGITKETYERFYDFEKIILKPILKEIYNLTGYSIEYVKLKNSEGKTSKIRGLEFRIIHILDETIDEKIENLLTPLKDRILNYEEIKVYIKEKIRDEGLDNVSKKLQYLDKEVSGKLDKAIFSIFNKESKDFENMDSYMLITKIEEEFTNRFIFESRLYKELLKCKFYYNYSFLKELRKIKENQNFEYVDTHYKINIIYNGKKDKSVIKIYKK